MNTSSEMLSSDVVAMTHRGTTKGMKDGKEVTESHRSLHVFQKNGGKVAGGGERAVADRNRQSSAVG